MAVHEDTRSIGELLNDLGNQVSSLVRSELNLARVEVTSSVSRMGRGAATAGIGGVLVFAGLLALLAALTLGLIEAGVDPWLAALIVAVVVLVGGGVAIFIGANQIRSTQLAPTQTAESVRDTVEVVKESIK
jgi:hypothetical protein